MVKVLTVILMFWACSNILQAQIKYGLRIADSGRSENFYSAIAQDDGFIISSKVFQSTEPFCFQFEKIDWEGSFVWHKMRCYEDYFPGTAMVKNSIDEIIMVHNQELNPNILWEPYIAKISSSGEIIFTNPFQAFTNSTEFFRDIVIVNDEKYFVVGEEGANNYFGNANAYFLLFDNNLEKLYSKVIDFEMALFPRKIEQDYDGNLLVTAYEWLGEFDDGVFDGELYNYFDDLLFKINPENGDTLWTKYNVLAPESSKHTKDINGWFIQKYNTGYLVAGTQHIPNEHLLIESWFTSYHSWKLAFLDSNFQEQWSVDIQDSIEYDFEKPLILDDGSILLGGVGREYYNITPDDYPQFVFMKFSPEGELLWKKQYLTAVEGDLNEVNLYNTAEFWPHPEGGYVLTGPIRYGTYDEDGEYINNRNVYFMWIDENGCINQGQCANPILQIEIPPANNLVHLPVDEIKNSEIQIYPNPANDRVNIALPASLQGKKYNLALYDALGRKVWEAENRQLDYNIDISSFPNGLYHAQLSMEHIDLATQKLVIMK